MLKLVERSGKWHIHGTHLGARVRESTGLDISDKAKAEQILQQRIAGIEAGIGIVQPGVSPTTSAITLRELLLQQAELRVAIGYSPGYLVSANNLVNKLGKAGDIPATEIIRREAEIVRVFSDVKRSSMAYYLGRIRSAQKYGMEKGIIPAGASIKAPTIKAVKDTVWDKDQVQCVYKNLVNNLDFANALILVLLFTGLRVGEVSRIKTNSVDLAEGVFMVEETGYLKTKTKPRHHPIAEPLVPVFQWLLKNQADKNGFLFGRGTARTCLHSEVNERAKQFANICRKRMMLLSKNGVAPFIRVHDLRHTFAKLLVSQNVASAYELKELLGHSTIEMTERYIGKLNVNKDLLKRLGGLTQS